MCGILLVHGKTGPLDRAQCLDALSTLGSRGPDFSYANLYDGDRLFFGQTVLSITGRPDGQVATYHRERHGEIDVIFNGQIYNFRQLERSQMAPGTPANRTGSDTETLARLHAQLPARRVFELVEGMYCYAVYDAARRSVSWARDPIGEKILFVFEDERLLVLSSELSPFLMLCPGLRIDREVLREYFFTRHLLTDRRTAFRGVEVVPAGSLHEYDLSSVTRVQLARRSIHSFVDPDAAERLARAPMGAAIDQLDDLLRANARALVPDQGGYGAIVSGGIDSTLAAWYMQDARAPVRNISLTFPGKDPVSEQVDRFATHFRAPIEHVLVGPEPFAEAMEQCYLATCAPIATHSFVSQGMVSAAAHRGGLKVLIGGDGADELFGGYEWYRVLQSDPPTAVPDLNPSPYSGLVPGAIRFADWDPSSLADRLRATWHSCLSAYAFVGDVAERVQQAALLCDTVVELESVGIRAADQMNMLHSVEGRGFYLTDRVVRCALNLPIRYKIDGAARDEQFVLKPLLKTLFAAKFGQALVFPKQGFSGYPNEAARILLDGGDGLGPAFDFLEIANDPSTVWDRTTEWKLMNVALFLRFFRRYA